MARKSRKKTETIIHNDDPYYLWMRILAGVGNEQWEETIPLIHSFLELPLESQDRVVTYQNLGYCYTALEQYDEALAAFAEAESALPDNLETTYNRALVLAFAGRLDEAEAVFKDMSKRWRRQVRQWDVARILGTLRDIQNSNLPRGAYLAEHLQARAEDNLEVGDFQLAEQKYRRSIAILPESSEGHFGLGISLIGQEKFQEGLNALITVHRLTPDHIVTLHNIGYVYNQINQPADAISWLKKAVEADPSYLSAAYQLGLAYEQSGQIEGAVSWWQTILKKEPEYYSAQEKLHEYGRSDPPQEPPLPPQTQKLQRLVALAKKQMRHPRRIRSGSVLLTVEENMGFTMEDFDNLGNATVYFGKPFEVGTIQNDDMFDLMGFVKLLLTTMNADNTRHVALIIHYKSHPSFAYNAVFKRNKRVDFESDGRFLTDTIPTFFKLKVDSDIASLLGDPMQGVLIYIKESAQKGTIVSTISYSGAI